MLLWDLLNTEYTRPGLHICAAALAPSSAAELTGSVCGGSSLPQLGVLPPWHLQNLSLPRLFWGACQNFSSRTEELYVLNLNLLLPNFESDCILVVMENYKYLLTGNYVSLIVCNGGKLHGEVLV